MSQFDLSGETQKFQQIAADIDAGGSRYLPCLGFEQYAEELAHIPARTMQGLAYKADFLSTLLGIKRVHQSARELASSLKRDTAARRTQSQ